MSYTVIISTFNEAQNLAVLLPRVKRYIGKDDDILVVDDGSDDVPDVCRGAGVTCIRGPGRGLTAAERFGIARVTQLGFVIMDGDLQHDPKYIPALTAGLSSGMLTIGSRYVEGGGWHEGFRREAMSRLACSLAYPLLTRVKDCTSGFFAMPTKAFCFNAVDLYAPKVLLEVLVKCPPEKIREIPITFGTRAFGKSTYMNSGTIAKYARQVAGLYVWRYAKAKPGSGAHVRE
ncbi:MAG: glycosyltransferase [Phaeospirillum sp.]|nr:glycosyltransferase [Phaeospirillum sp.]